MIKVLIIIISLFSISVSASISGDTYLTGKVISFDSKRVKISQRGVKTMVPRSSIPKYYKLKPGLEVTAILDSKVIAKKIKKLKK